MGVGVDTISRAMDILLVQFIGDDILWILGGIYKKSGGDL